MRCSARHTGVREVNWRSTLTPPQRTWPRSTVLGSAPAATWSLRRPHQRAQARRHETWTVSWPATGNPLPTSSAQSRRPSQPCSAPASRSARTPPPSKCESLSFSLANHMMHPRVRWDVHLSFLFVGKRPVAPNVQCSDWSRVLDTVPTWTVLRAVRVQPFLGTVPTGTAHHLDCAVCK